MENLRNRENKAVVKVVKKEELKEVQKEELKEHTLEKNSNKETIEDQMIKDIVKSRSEVTQGEIELQSIYDMNEEAKRRLGQLADLACEGENTRM